MKIPRLVAAGGVALVLAGCGPPLRSNYAEILIETNPPGATCAIGRADQPLAVVETTPGIVNLDPAVANGLSVSCRRPGYADIVVALPPNGSANAWRYPEPQNVLIPLVPVPTRVSTR